LKSLLNVKFPVETPLPGGAALETLLLRLPLCVNRDAADAFALDFCYLNSKGARRRCAFLADAKSSLGDAKSSLGDAKSSLGDAESSLGDAKSSLGDAKSSLGDAKSLLGGAKSSLGDVKSWLGDN
jgi:hypothetical protein